MNRSSQSSEPQPYRYSERTRGRLKLAAAFCFGASAYAGTQSFWLPKVINEYAREEMNIRKAGEELCYQYGLANGIRAAHVALNAPEKLDEYVERARTRGLWESVDGEPCSLLDVPPDESDDAAPARIDPAQPPPAPPAPKP